MTKTYLGLDIGTASVGFCLLERDPDRSEGRIIRAGVRIFPEALEGKSEESKKPKNVTRRDMRLRRRQLRHRKIKRRLIREALHGAGLLASPAPRAHAKGDTKGEAPNHVYRLRRDALSRRLEPEELGRVLRHLAQRTGFAGSPKAAMEESHEADDDAKKKKAAKSEREKEEETIKAEIESLRGELGGLTLGAHLADRKTQRRRHIGQDMVRRELEEILEAQKKFHPGLLTGEFCGALRKIMFHRRPIFWRWKSLGKCRYEPDSRLPMKADWRAQQFIMLQTLNDLRLAGGNQRPLNDGERAVVRDLMMSSAKVTFGKIREALKPLWKEDGAPLKSEFNFETGADQRKDLPGNAAEALLRRVFGEGWNDDPRFQSRAGAIRRDIAQWKWEVEYEKVRKGYRPGKKGLRVEIKDHEQIKSAKSDFVRKAMREWSVTAAEAEALADATLPGGWMRFSEKVIERMLPEMERGEGMTDVLKKFYPPADHLLGENRAKLPSHHRALPDARNPVVIRCLNETRKVVNNLIRAYGKPDHIRIEMARDVKLAGKKKAAALKKNRERKKARDKARKWLGENGLHPDDWNIRKHMLWEESNHRCLYSGDEICADDLFRRGKYQIEHIMPRSRSWDDGDNNLLLCRADLNQRKGDRTPYEAFGKGDAWDNMVRRVTDKKLKLPDAKVKRFLRQTYKGVGDDDGEDGEQANSRLSDTGYAAGLVRDFVAQLYPKGEAIDWAAGRPPRVQVVNGRITSQLGRAWNVYRQFNKAFIDSDGGRKNRDDHRHHALDAVIIALTTPGLVNHLASRFNEQRREGKPYQEIVENLKLRRPWRSFHEDVAGALGDLVVSYRTDAKVSGALTQDAHLGVQTLPDGTKRFVKRIALKGATAGDIRNIIDPDVKNIVWEHVRGFDETGLMPECPDDKPDGKNKAKINKAVTDAVKKAFAKPDCPPRMKKKGAPGAGPPVRRVRIKVEQQEHLTVPVRGKAVALKGGNHHAALYKAPGGKILHDPVSKLDAMRRVQGKSPVVSPTHPEDSEAELLFSLVKRDVLERTDPETGEITYWRVDSLWENRVTLCLHTDASKSERQTPYYWTLLEKGYRKVAVDPIGRVRNAR